jgi:hypothetical protein
MCFSISNAITIITYYVKAIPLRCMIRYVSAILLLFAFALQSFNGLFIVISYYANTSAYSKDCVNRFRPQMHCEGKCIMMKKMMEAEKKDQQAPQLKFEIKNDVFTSDNIVALSVGSYSISEENDYAINSGKSSCGFLQSIFHPPAVS